MTSGRGSALLGALLLSAAALPSGLAAMSQAGPDAERPHFVKATSSIIRKIGGKDVRFRLTLEASEWDDGYESLGITISRKTKPGGGAPNFSESQLLSTRLEPGSVVISSDLKSGVIDTGDQLGDWGRVAIEFASTGPKSQGCGPGVDKRPGELSKPPGGSFNFKTGNPVFGAIKVVPKKAVATAGICKLRLLRTGIEACPSPQKRFITAGGTGSGEWSLEAERDQGAANARVDLVVHEQLSETQSLQTRAFGKVPAGSLQVQNDLHPAVLAMPADTPFLAGSISMIEPGPTLNGPVYECGSDKQYRTLDRDGSLDGALEMKLTGQPKFIVDDDLTIAYLLVQKRIVEESVP